MKNTTANTNEQPFEVKFHYGENDNLELMQETFLEIMELIRKKGLTTTATRHLFSTFGSLSEWLKEYAKSVKHETLEAQENG